MINRLETKQKKSEDLYNQNIEQRVNIAKLNNQKLDVAAFNARMIQEKKDQDTYEQFSEQVARFHEKLLIKKELAEWKQYDIKEANQKEIERHQKNAAQVKQLDRNKLLESIQLKQKKVAENVERFEKDNIENWRLINEEEEIRKRERQKKIDRQQRKLDIKKEKVV